MPLAGVLRNPFYVGVILLRQTGESYLGIHELIVSKRIFDGAQAVLDGKLHARPIVHDFLFRRMITCSACEYSLIGERQKGRVIAFDPTGDPLRNRPRTFVKQVFDLLIKHFTAQEKERRHFEAA